LTWAYSQVADRFVFDEERKKQLTESNPFAAHDLMERLIKAYRRGFWHVTQDEIKRLEQSLLELDALLESKG
jgi:cobaltochelatase CobN